MSSTKPNRTRSILPPTRDVVHQKKYIPAAKKPITLHPKIAGVLLAIIAISSLGLAISHLVQTQKPHLAWNVLFSSSQSTYSLPQSISATSTTAQTTTPQQQPESESSRQNPTPLNSAQAANSSTQSVNVQASQSSQSITTKLTSQKPINTTTNTINSNLNPSTAQITETIRYVTTETAEVTTQPAEPTTTYANIRYLESSKVEAPGNCPQKILLKAGFVANRSTLIDYTLLKGSVSVASGSVWVSGGQMENISAITEVETGNHQFTLQINNLNQPAYSTSHSIECHSINADN